MVEIISFQKTVKDFYRQNKRAMPWREDISPYAIFVSEVMLQQTQVARVLVKYPEFISRFPTFRSLADSHTTTLLRIWKGMGYNRRALYLKKSAQTIMGAYRGILPSDTTLLDALPGIGYATACSIAAFAYNQPVVFIETNIRRVFIHHFFSHADQVSDTQITPLVEKTLDTKNPREWYWALMDYGAHLAKSLENPNVKSSHYVKQKKFEGSVRQLRGEVLRLLLQKPYPVEELAIMFIHDKRFSQAISGMKKDGLIKEKNGNYII